ncbi:hypothetical protein [Agrococcus sp. Marseille-Q4369]|uniref:esterase/lipase family protein n=1 Tax=Agrococcus sp. Marseille-Q4369 TaxID=2810513 RepID=UPI001B8D25C4|nr:hypothetical protein [Agrococcus sp. Marseille-Q4369]QUW18810.1 hypothetical protein JSQ78_13715 [Agrococcus sp. Marseille-Q4369]
MRIPLRPLIPPRFRDIDPIDPAEVAVWARDYAFAARMHVRSTLEPAAPKALGIPGSRVHVVCIPGVIEGWHFMEPLAKRLVRAGFAAHFVPELGRNVAPVLDSAPVVGAVVDRVAAAHPHASIVLVGHSKGGLIGKRLLVDRALEPAKPQPAGLVTLATPFAGSSRAALLPGEYIREFDPSNAMLAALAAERSADARIRVVLPQIDPHVPKNRVPDGMRGVRLRESGHFRPLATAEAARAIVAAIDELTGAPALRAGLEGAAPSD